MHATNMFWCNVCTLHYTLCTQYITHYALQTQYIAHYTLDTPLYTAHSKCCTLFTIHQHCARHSQQNYIDQHNVHFTTYGQELPVLLVPCELLALPCAPINSFSAVSDCAQFVRDTVSPSQLLSSTLHSLYLIPSIPSILQPQ